MLYRAILASPFALLRLSTILLSAFLLVFKPPFLFPLVIYLTSQFLPSICFSIPLASLFLILAWPTFHEAFLILIWSEVRSVLSLASLSAHAHWPDRQAFQLLILVSLLVPLPPSLSLIWSLLILAFTVLHGALIFLLLTSIINQVVSFFLVQPYASIPPLFWRSFRTRFEGLIPFIAVLFLLLIQESSDESRPHLQHQPIHYGNWLDLKEPS